MKEEREGACLALFMAITCLEAFLNIWCQTTTQFDPKLSAHGDQIRADLKNRRGVKHALKTWPKLLFGSGIDLSKGPGQHVSRLIQVRNYLMHYTTSLESFTGPGIQVHGLSDLSVFESLSKTDAVAALSAVLAVLQEFFSLRPNGSRNSPAFEVYFWTGFHPDEQAALFDAPA